MIAEPDEEDPTAKCWTRPTTGAVDMNSIVNEFAKTEHGVVTFASSQGREASEESAWGNGAFTNVLIEGLAGKADLLRAGRSRSLNSMRSSRTG